MFQISRRLASILLILILTASTLSCSYTNMSWKIQVRNPDVLNYQGKIGSHLNNDELPILIKLIFDSYSGDFTTAEGFIYPYKSIPQPNIERENLALKMYVKIEDAPEGSKIGADISVKSLSVRLKDGTVILPDYIEIETENIPNENNYTHRSTNYYHLSEGLPETISMINFATIRLGYNSIICSENPELTIKPLLRAGSTEISFQDIELLSIRHSENSYMNFPTIFVIPAPR